MDMTDEELAIASVPAASDCLEEHGMPGAAALLRAAPARAKMLGHAIDMLESTFRDPLVGRAGVRFERIIDIIAEARGESPEATLARLARPGPSPATVGQDMPIGSYVVVGDDGRYWMTNSERGMLTPIVGRATRDLAEGELVDFDPATGRLG